MKAPITGTTSVSKSDLFGVHARSSTRSLRFSAIDQEVKSDPAHIYVFRLTRPYIEGKKVLDIGCWTGEFIKLLAGYSSLSVGIDIEKRALKVANANIPDAHFIVASVFNAPFREETFDVVTFWTVIEHLPKGSEKDALLEINRILKKNGLLFLSTENFHFLSILLDPAFFIAGHRHYSKNEIKKLLTSSGFIVEAMFTNEGLFRCLYFLFFYFFKHILRKKISKTLQKFFNVLQEKELSKGKGFKTLFAIGKK